MSRSYKKTPMCKSGHHPFMKHIYNRDIRNKELFSGSYYKKMNQPWNICDYKSTSTFEEYVKKEERFLLTCEKRYGIKKTLEDYTDWKEQYRDWYKYYKMK